MRRNKIIPLVIIVMFCISFVHEIKAYSYLEIETPASFSIYDKATCILTHSTGKFILGYYSVTDTNFLIEIISSTGTHLSTVEIDASDYSSSSQQISISEFDNDEIFVAIAFRTSGATHTFFALYKVNINSYTKTQVGSNTQISGHISQCRLGISKAIEYDDDFYWIVRVLSRVTSAYCYIRMFKYDYDTSTLSLDWTKSTGETDIDPDGNPPVWFIQDDFAEEKVYLLTIDGDDEKLPTYYYIDLTGDDSDCVKLANHPYTDAIDTTSSSPQQYYIGGGKETSGDLIYLYWTWVRPDIYNAVYRKIQLRQHRIVFNGTVQPDNVTASNERLTTIYPNLLTSTYNCWALGSMEDYDYVHVYYPYIESEEYKIKDAEFEIEDWLDYEDEEFTFVSSTETTDIPPQKSVIDYIAKEPTSQFQVNCQYTDEDFWIYYGLSALEQDWDITLSYIPSDSPLETYTNYQFSLTTTLNGYATQSTVIGYFDDIQIFSVQTNTVGQYTFTSYTGIAGYHEILFKIYYNNIYRYNESFSYFYVSIDDEIPDTPTMIPMITNLVTVFIPVMIIMGVPSIAFGKVGGSMGFMVGLAIGAFICSTAGFIPTYVMYLIILCVVGGIVLIFRSGGGM